MAQTKKSRSVLIGEAFGEYHANREELRLFSSARDYINGVLHEHGHAPFDEEDLRFHGVRRDDVILQAREEYRTHSSHISCSCEEYIDQVLSEKGHLCLDDKEVRELVGESMPVTFRRFPSQGRI